MKKDSKSPKATRDPARRTNRGGKGYVAGSLKNGQVESRHESLFEHSVAKLLELDPRVRSYRSQPYTVDMDSGKLFHEPPKRVKGSRFYTTDFHVELSQLQVALEVKPAAFMAQHRERLKDAKAALFSHGIRLVVVNDEDFTSTLLRNIDLLYQYHVHVSKELSAGGASEESNPVHRNQLAEWADQVSKQVPFLNKPTPVCEALRGLTPMNYFVGAAVLNGVLAFDMNNRSFESMDFDVWSAMGALTGFEVINFG